MNLLSVQGLRVCYGAVTALDKASLEVKQGEVVAMIGPNGAGKSTCLRAIAGILPHYDGRIDAGEILFSGRRINGLPPHKLVTMGLALVPEGRHVFSSMTVEENLEIGAHSVRRDGHVVGELMSPRSGTRSVLERMEEIYKLFPRLKERRKQRAGTLSTGEQQLLAMGRGLMIRPELLLVDEPTVGLSPNLVDVVLDILVKIAETGTSLLLVEQNAAVALDVCHRAYVFEIGGIAFEGRRQELVEDERIRRAYLG